MSFILGIFLTLALVGLMIFVVNLSAHRKNRSVWKWLNASFLLPFLPFVLLFMPAYKHKKGQAPLKAAADQKTADQKTDIKNPPHPIVSFGEYIGIFLIAVLEIFLIWSLNNWISQPWNGDDPDFVYDKRLIEKPSAETLKSANVFLDAFFHPEMTGERISMPPFKASKTKKHCFSLCGYSGICDQIKLMQCFRDYKMNYEAVARYLDQNYAYPWTKPLVRTLARENDREGILNYGRLSQQLEASKAAFETLQKQYEAQKTEPVLLAKAIQTTMLETGAPDFVRSEEIYKKSLRFFR